MDLTMNLGIASFTLVEDAALVAWLALVRAGRRTLGVLVLPVGFFVEHVIAQKVKGGVLTFKVVGQIAVNAALETVIWVVWLLLWGLFPPLAVAWLQLTLTVEHNLTDNIFHDRPLFSDLLNRRVYGFTTLENIGATGWLGFVGAGLPLLGVAWLVVFQFLEHRRALAIARLP